MVQSMAYGLKNMVINQRLVPLKWIFGEDVVLLV